MLLYQLLRPLAYLWISDSSKPKIDWGLPLIFGALCVALLRWLPGFPGYVGDKGLISLMVGLLQILPGFYLTALAAVATFNQTDMDKPLPAPTPTVAIKWAGATHEIKLTRRRMLCMLFGYLAFISFALYFLSIAALMAASGYASSKFIYEPILSVVMQLAYMVLVGQLIFVTMFGLYQLSDRIHQPDP